VQKVIPLITIQDFGGIAEENHQRSLLTAAMLSIIAELKVEKKTISIGTLPFVFNSDTTFFKFANRDCI